MRVFTRIAALAGFVLAGHAFAGPAAAPANDVELFFKNPRYSAMTLSPDGNYLAALAPSPGTNRRNLALIDLTDRSKSRFLTNMKEQDIAGFFWKGNDRIVFTLDADGNEGFGLYSISTKGGLVKALVDAYKLPFGATAQVLDELEDDPKAVLIQLNDNDRSYFDVYRLDVVSGKRVMVARNDHTILGWGTDNKGRVRFAAKGAGPNSPKGAGLTSEIMYRSDEKSPWVSLAKFTFPEPAWSPLGFDYDDRTMFIATNVGHDKSAIYRYDPETKTLGEKVFENAQVDAGGLMFSSLRKKLVGATYYTDKPQRVIWDAETKAIYDTLAAKFGDKQFSVVSVTKDEKKFTVLEWSDRDPGTFWLFNRDGNTFERLAQSRPEIDPAQMSPMLPFTFTARDGLVINGYITVPKDAKGPVPLIVNPHGGPYGPRDTWGFNPEHQFFAKRGYATMQVNYRGSGGYGKSFMEAGYKRWGREMQNDLTDAVQWAVAKGYADGKRVCIYGGSYGGYATMAGMTFTPELYKCGVNYVGVTDIPLLFSTMPKYWEPTKDQMRIQIGDPDDPKDLQMLKDASPLYFVDRIQAPIFIVQGGRDPRVNRKHAENLRDAMAQKNKTYEWLLKENEGHGFRKEENRLELYAKMGEFFAKHL